MLIPHRIIVKLGKFSGQSAEVYDFRCYYPSNVYTLKARLENGKKITVNELDVDVISHQEVDIDN